MNFTEFINPYGIQSTTPSSSEASSEKLSQFGTARDYPDFDTQNDLFWYDEKDDGNFMTPSFQGPDFFFGPAEDKFIMISHEDMQHENSCYFNETSPFNAALAPKNDVSEVPLMNKFHLDKTNELGSGFKRDSETCAHCGFSVPLCDCCKETKGFYDDYSHPNTKALIELNEDFKGCSDVYNKVPQKKDYKLNDVYSFEVIHGGHKDLNQSDQVVATEDGDAADEILMYNNQEEEFEVFHLRIIHRKNRSVRYTPLYPSCCTFGCSRFELFA